MAGGVAAEEDAMARWISQCSTMRDGVVQEFAEEYHTIIVVRVETGWWGYKGYVTAVRSIFYADSYVIMH